MSPQQRGIGFKGPRQQRGAIGLMAAVTLGMVLLFMLLVVDSGRLYLEQRKLQRVADMAALEAVSRGGTCGLTLPNAQSLAEENAKRNSFIPGDAQQIATACGTLETNETTQVRKFKEDTKRIDAIQVIATTIVPTSIAGGLWSAFSKSRFNAKTYLTASAVGSNGGPKLAQLSIRSTLLEVNSDNSLLLDTLFTNLLGGNLVVDAVGWNGLINTDINLLQYLNELSRVSLGLQVGDYTKLLGTNATVTQLIKAAANVAEVNGSTLDVQTALGLLSVAAIKETPVKIADLFNLKTGTNSAGLDANVQLLQLIQAFVQAANKNNAVAATVPIDIPGIASITTQIHIIEPPQISSIGDPTLAVNAEPNDANAIYVRTAQIRTLISIKLPILDTVNNLTKSVQNLLSPVTKLLDGLFCALGLCSYDIQLVPSPTVIHINLDIAKADSLLIAYSCSKETKSITTKTTSSAAEIKIGKAVNPSAVFSSKTSPTFTPLPLVDIGKKCVLCPGGRVPFGGGGVAITAHANVAGKTENLVFSKVFDAEPPNIKQPSAIRSMHTTDIISTLKNTLTGTSIDIYEPADNTGLLNQILSTTEVLKTLTVVVELLATEVLKLLSKVADPLINQLLALLGINLMDTVIGANLSCGQGGRAQLVM